MLSLALTWAVLGSGFAQAGAISVTNGRLTANVTEAPLGKVIEEIARQSGLRIVLHTSGDVPVTLRLVDRPLEESLPLIVGSHDLALVYSRAGLREVHIYSVNVPRGDRDAERTVPSADWALAGAGDVDSSTREEAVRALAKSPAPEAVAALTPILTDDDARTLREASAWALGETHSEAAVPALTHALLHDERRRVRQAAAEALGKIRSASAVEALIEATTDPFAAVREGAVEALGAIGSELAIATLVDVSQRDENATVRQTATRVLQRRAASDSP